MKRLIASVFSAALVAAFALTSVATPADAKACRDAKGKFAKCPPATAMTAKKPCRDAKGKFVKCGASTMTAKKH